MNATELLNKRIEELEKALVRCAEVSGADMSSGVPTSPDITVWAVQEVEDLRHNYDKSDFRQAVVNMVNMLGAPQSCGPACGVCQGCEYERIEAISDGLIALGYLDPPKFRLTGKVTTNKAGGEIKHFVLDGPKPDPLDAWERFMKKEFNTELSPGWRDL